MTESPKVNGMGVDAGYDNLGNLDSRGGEVGRDAKRYISVVVGHGAVDKGDIEFDGAVAEELRHLTEKPRSRSGISLVDPSLTALETKNESMRKESLSSGRHSGEILRPMAKAL